MSYFSEIKNSQDHGENDRYDQIKDKRVFKNVHKNGYIFQ